MRFGLYNSTPAFLTKTRVSDIGSSTIAIATRTACFCCSVSKANTLLSVISVVLFIVYFSFHHSYTVNLGTGCELNEAISLLARSDSFTKLVND